MTKKILLPFFLVFVQFVCFAATNTYSGSTTVGGKLLWSTAANWSLGAIPTATDDVVIPSGKTVILDVTSVSANSMTISGTLDLNKSADITINTQLIVVTSPGGHINFDHSIIRLPSNVALYLQNGSGSLNGSCNNNDEVFVGTVQYAVCVGGGALYLFAEIEAAGGINIVTAGVIGASQSICSGATPATLTSTTAGIGSGTITYEWQTNATGSFVTIPSATSSTYSPPALTASTSYRRITKSVFAGYTFYSAYTTAMTITVNALPNNISNGFSATTICNGGSPQLNFDADDTTYSTPYSITYKNDITLQQYSVSVTSKDNFSFTPGDNPTSNTGYTLVSISNAICTNSLVSSFLDSGANLIVRPIPIATISGTTGVCTGAASPNITFTNLQTVGLTVNYTINGGTSQTVNINASSSANVAVATSTAGTFVYNLVSATYQSTPNCSNTLTGSASVTVNSPNVPIVTITQPTCAVATGSITITAVSGETYSFDGSAYSGTLVYSSLVQGSSHTVYARNVAGCVSLAKNVVISSLVTNSWNGSTWSTGSPPTSNQKIVFNGGYSSTGDLEACSCQVNSGAIIINSGHTLKITNEVAVSGGSLIFENNASLVQINEDPTINTGDITYRRTTRPIRKFDYTYWSSPVANYTLGGVSPNTLEDKFYSFNPDTDGWEQKSSGTVMEKGIGYIIRGPQSYDPVNFAVFPAFFKGVPNNGTFSITSVVEDKSYLLGNPYPSALDADTFLTANAGVLDGTIYFWTHNTAIADNEYTSDDYASYNGVGGVETVAAGGEKPSGKIASGQGFFVSSKIAPISGSTVVFNNSMRVGVGAITGDNSQFFRIGSTKVKSVSVIEKHRIWLNLSNDRGAFKQTLIGYVTGATNEYDGSFDGESFDGNEFIDFYSVNQDKNLVIQGRSLPFDETDTVQLGYSSTIAGSFAIGIDEVDGALANQAVFIEDKDAKVIHNLKEGAYDFTTVTGIFNDRFVLRYTNKTLGMGDFKTRVNSVLVSNRNKQIKIDSPNETIDKVILYDLSGRKVFQKNNINDDEFSVFNLVSKQQVLVVKVTLQNGHTVTKKIMY